MTPEDQAPKPRLSMKELLLSRMKKVEENVHDPMDVRPVVRFGNGSPRNRYSAKGVARQSALVRRHAIRKVWAAIATMARLKRQAHGS